MKESILEELQALSKRQEPTAIPTDIDPWDLLVGMIRGVYKVTPMQLRGIEIYLERVRPKLTAVAVGHMDSGGFAALLDKAIARSAGPLKLIDAKPVEGEQQHAPSELKGPMSRLRRW